MGRVLKARLSSSERPVAGAASNSIFPGCFDAGSAPFLHQAADPPLKIPAPGTPCHCFGWTGMEVIGRARSGRAGPGATENTTGILTVVVGRQTRSVHAR